MSLKWTYLLIIILYVILFVIAALNKHIEKQWQVANPEALDGVRIWRTDFFSTVASVSVIGAIIINLLCLIGGRGLNGHSLVIALFILGMAYISNTTKFFVSKEEMNVGGHYYKKANIDKIACNKKNGKIQYKVYFKEAIDGYNYTIFYSSPRYRKAMYMVLNEYPIEK